MVASTNSLAANAWRDANSVPAAKIAQVLQIVSFSRAVATAQLDETDDETEIAYLPPGMTIYQVIVQATDMDTGAAALAYNIEVNGSSIGSFTVGQSAGSALVTLAAPVTTTGIELLSMVITTGATTPAAGTITVRLIYTTP